MARIFPALGLACFNLKLVYSGQVHHVEKFSEIVSHWKGAYVCAIQSHVGLKTIQGERLLLYGKTVLEPFQSGIDQTPFLFETKHIFAGRFVRSLKSDDVPALIEKAKIGHMDNSVALFPKRNSDPFSPYSTSNYHPLVSNLFIRGESRHYIQGQAGFPQYLNWEMKSADTPFDTFDELLEHCGLPALDIMRDETSLEIVAKAPGQIDSCSIIADGNGVIECRIAKALDISKLKIGIRAFGKNHEIMCRKSLKGDLIEWHEADESRVGKCKIHVGDSPVLEAYLSYEGIPIDQSIVSDPQKHLNPRHVIHQFFDPSNDRLPLMLLKPDKDKAHVFEGAVSTLLTLFGFSVSHYGRFPILQEGPDIIATTPRGHVAVVECTLGGLNQNNKIAKLVQRTHSIGKKLENAGHGDIEIQPVIVTLLSRGEVVAELEAARANGIAVVCKENLEEVLKQIELPLNANQFFSDLKKLIPSPKDESLFRF